MEKYLDFLEEEVSIENLFRTLKDNKKTTKNKNMVIFLSEKFIKTLLKKEYETQKGTVNREETITMSHTDDKGFSYKVSFSKFKDMFRLDDIQTNNPEYENAYKPTIYQDDIDGALFISTIRKERKYTKAK